MKDILIIGKKSFLGSNLKKYLSIYFNVRNSSFEEFIKNKLYLNKYSYIINTSIHQKYIKNKYNKKYDLDLNIINKLKFSNAFYIFLNTRKIYIPGENLTEKSIIFPESNYAINKYKTECFLKKK